MFFIGLAIGIILIIAGFMGVLDANITKEYVISYALIGGGIVILGIVFVFYSRRNNRKKSDDDCCDLPFMDCDCLPMPKKKDCDLFDCNGPDCDWHYRLYQLGDSNDTVAERSCSFKIYSVSSEKRAILGHKRETISRLSSLYEDFNRVFFYYSIIIPSTLTCRH